MKRKANLFALAIATFFSFSAIAQNVTGVVSDAASGEPVPSVSVKEKGTNNAAITNFEGKYSIKAGNNAVLIFSSMGYASNEASVTGKTLNVSLKMDDGELDEIVVTAYGITRDKKSLGYAVEEVGGAEIKNSGETNMISGISAKVSGVQVTNSSGAAGAASYIKIRGNATFSSNDNQPLMVVDGVPIDNSQIRTEDLRSGVAYSNRAIDINPDDIESLSVLKGGAAAALYGTRGANGVILITTKKGQYNQGFRVSFNSSLELTRINKMPETQNKYSQGFYGDYLGGTGNPFSWGPALTDLGYDADNNITQDSSSVVGPWGVTPYDNVANFFKQGLRTNNSVTLSGGGAKTSYYLSVSNLRDNGIVPMNTFDRTTVRLTGSGQIATNLKATGSLSYSNSAGQRVQQGSNLSGLMLGLLRTPPSFDNSAGYENSDGTQRNYRSGGGYDNPFWTVNKNPFNDNVNRVFGYTSLEWSPLKNLLVKYRYGIDQYSDVRKQIIAKNSRTFPGGSIRDEAYTVREQNHDVTANYNTEFGDIGLNVLAGLNSNQRDYKSIYTYGSGLVLPDFYNMSNAQTQFAYESNTGRRLWGIYAEAQLDYKDWAFLTLTARRDQASTFGNVGTPIIYPSASLAVVLTDALDIKSDFLSMLKLRASTAQVGSEPPFASNATYFNQGSVGSGWINGISFPYLGATAFTQSDILGNPNLRPEYTSTNEVGVEIGLFKNKINTDVTVYQQASNDLIVPVPVAGASGFTNSFVNAGTMTNTGVEIALSANAVRTDDFNLDFGLTYTRNRNVVTKLADGVDVISLNWGFFGANQRLVEGEAYGTLYGDDWERDDNGNAQVDGNGFPIYSSTEVVVGNPNPDYLLGFNTDARYKNWSFNMLWDIRQGGDIWNGTRGALYYFGTHIDTDVRPDGTPRGGEFIWNDVVTGNSGVYAAGTLDADGNDIGGQPNTTPIANDIDTYAGGPLSGFTGASRPFIEDGSWIRLRNIGVSYEFDKGFAEKVNLKGLTIGVTARNLFLSTPYRGVDPETNLSGATNSQGADYFNMPNTSGVIFNLKANF
jgi:TonB-linked SusC/RagA family outer membrane protein